MYPEVFCQYSLPAEAFCFLLLIQCVELFALTLTEASCFIRAEQSPNSLCFYAVHEQTRDPECVKQVSRSFLFFAVVFLELKEVLDVCMPGFDVNCNGALSFPSALVHLSRCLVEDPEHGDYSWRTAVEWPDLWISSSDFVDRQTNASCKLGNLCTVYQRVLYAIHTVCLDVHQETWAHLVLEFTCIHQCGGCVNEILLTHLVLGWFDSLFVGSIDADRHSHEEHLRTLLEVAVDRRDQICSLEGSEAKEIKDEVSFLLNSKFHPVSVIL